MATKKKTATKPTEPKPKPKAEPGSPEHHSDRPYAGEASSSARARPYTGCGDPRRWQQRRRKR